jgi:hypothetical protein
MYSFAFCYILVTLILFPSQTSACMHYSATFPHATHLPFEASLTDDGIVTCWISMTYDQHNEQQTAFSNHRRIPQQIARPVTSSVTLAEEPEKGLAKRNAEMGGDAGDDEDIKAIWLPWEFTCLDGYQAHAGIGLRAVWYSAHGQEFEFVSVCEEDVLNDRWVYELDLWCGA